MYSGFVSHKKAINAIGIHQRFDVAAFKAIAQYLQAGKFPDLKEVLKFEGLGGPDGLKVKSPGENEPSHLYDPATDTGEVPTHIANHYDGLVQALQREDMIRAAFEAGWLAHYITDGLTPAHHFPLDEKLEEMNIDSADLWAKSPQQRLARAKELPLRQNLRRNWAIWGAKGLLTTHINFEIGVASALLIFPIRTSLDHDKLAKARREGPVEFFKSEARDIAKLDLYDRFYEKGWTPEIAQAIRKQLAPQTAQAIAIIWLLAYLEALQHDLSAIGFKASPPRKKR